MDSANTIGKSGCHLSSSALDLERLGIVVAEVNSDIRVKCLESVSNSEGAVRSQSVPYNEASNAYTSDAIAYSWHCFLLCS